MECLSEKLKKPWRWVVVYAMCLKPLNFAHQDGYNMDGMSGWQYLYLYLFILLSMDKALGSIPSTI